MRDLVDRMLATVSPKRYRIENRAGSFSVAIGGTTIDFGAATPAIDQHLEQLGVAIERCIACDRAQAMLVAADALEQPLPMWLVTGSSVLSAWLSWSRTEDVFRRRLTLSDRIGAAPVSGLFDRRARQPLGHTPAKIRVRNGLAVAERIELPGRLRCTGMFGRQARIRIDGGPLPQTIITALAEDPVEPRRRRVGAVVDHPFFTSSDLRVADIRNDGDTVVVEIESQWGPLAPVPEKAWGAVPPDADVSCPWRATRNEVADLYRLVDAGRHQDVEA